MTRSLSCVTSRSCSLQNTKSCTFCRRAQVRKKVKHSTRRSDSDSAAAVAGGQQFTAAAGMVIRALSSCLFRYTTSTTTRLSTSQTRNLFPKVGPLQEKIQSEFGLCRNILIVIVDFLASESVILCGCSTVCCCSFPILYMIHLLVLIEDE